MKELKDIMAVIIAALAILIIALPFALFWGLLAIMHMLASDLSVNTWLEDTREFFRSFSK